MPKFYNKETGYLFLIPPGEWTRTSDGIQIGDVILCCETPDMTEDGFLRLIMEIPNNKPRNKIETSPPPKYR